MGYHKEDLSEQLVSPFLVQNPNYRKHHKYIAVKTEQRRFEEEAETVSPKRRAQASVHPKSTEREKFGHWVGAHFDNALRQSRIEFPFQIENGDLVRLAAAGIGHGAMLNPFVIGIAEQKNEDQPQIGLKLSYLADCRFLDFFCCFW